MPIEIVQVDAFTSKPYRGNPAAICLTEGPQDEDWMRDVAREMNLSETAFLYPISGGYNLRWLTPVSEVDLCGHGTLATAHFLLDTGRESEDSPIRFKTRSGWVSAEKVDDWIELDFPNYSPKECQPPAGLLEALGVEAVYVGEYPKAMLVRVASEAEVRNLKPDLSGLQEIDLPKVCVTAKADSAEVDFVSRLFAPKIGIPEDPVNGNSHTALTPYWANELGKRTMISHYASARGGEIRVRLEGDRVKIGGQAVTVMKGTLLS